MSKPIRTSGASRRGARGKIRRARDPWRVLGQVVLIAAVCIFAVGLVVAGLFVGAAIAIGAHLPSVDALYAQPSEATRIYAVSGELIASLYQENRDSVPLSAMPVALQRAVVDTEDADFYQNPGISVRGILRAGLRNAVEGGYAEGGSTITQQLARNLFLTSQKSLTRKIAEIMLAVQIERRLTKDEILQRYLNQVYLGEGAYGVETASEVYFGKPAKRLTLTQSAMLAGLIRAPSLYSPYEHPARAHERLAEVLRRMVDRGDLTGAQMRAALAAPLALAAKGSGGLVGVRAPYFVSYILPQLMQRYGEDTLYKGGLRIYTTLDLTLQAAAAAALRQGIDAAQRQHANVSEGAVVIVDPRTGAIRAMVGGYDFRASQFNRAWQAHRQPGSAFKPFTYTAALMQGMPPNHTVLDGPLEFPLPDGTVWKPLDYDRKWHGLVTARYALENSLNSAAIRVEQQVGPRTIVRLAHRMGVQSTLQPTLSLTLGASDVTPLEMTTAYGVFADKGIRTDPMPILRVTDASGKVLEEHAPQRTVALSPEVAYVMTDMLKGVILRGTGVAANIGIPSAGKTGTADDYRNAWFIGFTPYLVTTVWVGNDDDSPMNKVTGGGVPAGIWAAIMKQATVAMPHDDWVQPDAVVQETVCGTTGLLAGPDCPDPRSDLYIKGTEPAAYAPSVPPAAAPASPAPAAQPVSAAAGPAAGAPAASAPAEAAQTSGGPITVTLSAPADGGQVTVPFMVQGTTRPGAAVHIVVQAQGAPVADVSLRADQSGAFAVQVRPSAASTGAVYVVSVTASVGLDSGSATVTVKPQ